MRLRDRIDLKQLAGLAEAAVLGAAKDAAEKNGKEKAKVAGEKLLQMLDDRIEFSGKFAKVLEVATDIAIHQVGSLFLDLAIELAYQKLQSAGKI